MGTPAKSTEAPLWRKGVARNTGWDVLSIPRSGTFARDFENRYYYLSDAMPVTWRELADKDDVARLAEAFRHAYGY